MAYYFSIDGKDWKKYKERALDDNGRDSFWFWSTPAGKELKQKVKPEPLGAPLYDYSFGQVRDAAQALGIKNVNKQREVEDILNYIRNPRAAQATQAQTETSPQAPVTPSPTVTETVENVPGSPSTYVPGQGVIDSTDAQGGQQTLINGMTPAEFDLEADLARIREQGNIETTIRNMITQSNNYIADVQARSAGNVATIGAGATKYTADRQKEATTYVADREKETALGVENIRTKGALDLQDIVNAGLKDVETIRGQSAKDVEKIRGEFDIQGEQIRGQTARDVAELDFKKGLYGSLVSAFNF
jgi:hypothetical protein